MEVCFFQNGNQIKRKTNIRKKRKSITTVRDQCLSLDALRMLHRVKKATLDKSENPEIGTLSKAELDQGNLRRTVEPWAVQKSSRNLYHTELLEQDLRSRRHIEGTLNRARELWSRLRNLSMTRLIWDTRKEHWAEFQFLETHWDWGTLRHWDTVVEIFEFGRCAGTEDTLRHALRILCRITDTLIKAGNPWILIIWRVLILEVSVWIS